MIDTNQWRNDTSLLFIPSGDSSFLISTGKGYQVITIIYGMQVPLLGVVYLRRFDIDMMPIGLT